MHRLRTAVSIPSKEHADLPFVLHFAIQSLLGAYLAVVLAWLVIRALVGDRSFFVAILSYMGVWLFFPLLIFWPWALLGRWKRSALALAIPGALFVWFYGPLLMPKLRPQPHPFKPVTIVTFNVRYLNTSIDALAEIMLQSGADIVALQEVAPYHQQHLAPLLAGHYPYHKHEPGTGLAVHSRHPILSARPLPLESWSAQSLVIEAGGTPFHLVNAHLARAGVGDLVQTQDPAFIRAAVDARKAQIAEIAREIEETGLPAILACDGNMTDLSSAYRQVTSALKDAYRERGWGLGHTLLIPRALEVPSLINMPVQRIDYLFYSPEIRANRVRVIPEDGGSDHRPVWAEFDLEPARASKKPTRY